MRTPNFFIVGAPKCGTTALYEYLKTHPRIFLSGEKEPHYFCDDFSPRYRTCSDEKTYLEKYFSGARELHTAVGEASVWYLYSRTAIRNIKLFNPRSKIVLMLRNPVDMLYSLHSQLVYNCYEEEENFEKSWGLQDARSQGNEIGPLCIEPAFLQYRAVASFGRQLQNVYSHFPRDQVHVIFYDDFKRDIAAVYGRLLAFLQVPDDGRTEFPVVNANKRQRSQWLAKFLHDTPEPLISAAKAIKKALGLKTLGIGRLVNKINAVEVQREALPENLRREVALALQSDIELLEDLTAHDLSGWKSCKAIGRA